MKSKLQTPEEAGTCEVGKYYLVTCAVVGLKNWEEEAGEAIIPIVGPAHTDKAFFDHKHYHIDGRFIGRKEASVISFFHKGKTSTIICFDEKKGLYFKSLTTRRMKCKVRFGGLDIPDGVFTNMSTRNKFGAWARSMVGKSCAGKKCPHYGTTMVEVDGRLVCPLHNLMSDEKQEKIEGLWVK